VTYTKVEGGSGNTAAANLEEASLDAETLNALAPHAALDIYSATQGNSDEMYFQMVDDDRASIIVSSWGSCEQLTAPIDLHIEHLALLEAAAQGQSFITAAGDDGSEDCWSFQHRSELAVDDPGSQPYATAVGGVQYGSTLSLSPTIQPRVWNDPTYSGGSGGGTSVIWNRPIYQNTVAASDPNAVTYCVRAQRSCRLVPDVSMLAEGFLIDTPVYGWDVIGGTSGSAPVFGAGIADLESLVHHRLGLLDPLLYSLSSKGAGVFTDVTLGNNDYHHRHHGLFPARPGYDIASGLGTVNLWMLYRHMPGQRVS
jgi:kumamolisin